MRFIGYSFCSEAFSYNSGNNPTRGLFFRDPGAVGRRGPAGQARVSFLGQDVGVLKVELDPLHGFFVSDIDLVNTVPHTSMRTKGAKVGPANRREREKEELRRKILDTSRRLFAEHGYEAVTMRTIAEAIEYTPRTIYLHFKDKEDLIRELCREDFRTFGEDLGKLAALPHPLERLRAAGHAYVAFAAQYPHHYKLMFMTPPPPKDPESDCGKGDPEEDAYALIWSASKEAMEKGLIRPDWSDPHLVAQTLWSGIHGVISLTITHANDPWVPWVPTQTRVDAMLDVLVRGISA
jgi:AcrR family transcriptional regulator